MSEAGPRLVLVGRVGGAFGVQGEIRLIPYTQEPEALLAYGPLLDEHAAVALSLTSSRPFKDGLIVRAAQVATREEAQALKGLQLYVERSRLPEPEEDDEFYHADLIGLAVRSPAGDVIGRVRSVQDFGAGELLEIEPAGGGATWLAAFTKAVVPEVRLSEGWLSVERPVDE